MSRTIPATNAPASHPAPVEHGSALRLALSGLTGWDARRGRLDPECADLWLLVEPEPMSSANQ